MKISLTCRCGAAIVLEDPGNMQAPGVAFGNHYNARGERLAIETRAREWLDRHQPCAAAEYVRREIQQWVDDRDLPPFHKLQEWAERLKPRAP